LRGGYSNRIPREGTDAHARAVAADFAEFNDSLDGIFAPSVAVKRAECASVPGLPGVDEHTLEKLVHERGIRAVLKSLHDICANVAESGDLCESLDAPDSAPWRKLAERLDKLTMSREAGAE
jgi:hypothetical protein